MIESTSHDAHDDFVRGGFGIVQRAEFKLSGRTVGDELDGFHAISLIGTILVNHEIDEVLTGSMQAKII